MVKVPASSCGECSGVIAIGIAQFCPTDAGICASKRTTPDAASADDVSVRGVVISDNNCIDVLSFRQTLKSVIGCVFGGGFCCFVVVVVGGGGGGGCLLYTSPSPRDLFISRMPSSA